MERIRRTDVDSTDEVCKVFNQVIDNMNSLEGKILWLISKDKKKAPKGKQKGIALVKTLLLAAFISIVVICGVVHAEFQQISYNNVTNDNTLTTILRERLGFTGDIYTFRNGLTIDNATNNVFEWNENSEDLLWTFSTNEIALSSTTGVTDVNFASLFITMSEISAPGSPPSNTGVIYTADATGTTSLFFKDSAGVATNLLVAGTGNTLDEAYDQGGAGTGRTITVDTGAVVLNNTDADTAYLLSVTPTPGSSAALGGIQITSGANATQDSINIVNSGSGDDIEAGNGAFTVSSTGAIVGDTLTVTTLFENAIIAAAAGNVALTLDGAGNGTITLGATSTGNIINVRDTSFTGALTANGAVTLGDASGDNITVTGTVVSDVTMDDGTTDSPTLTLQDQTNESVAIVKKDNGDTEVTIPADTDFEIVTGNLAVGNGSPGTAAMDGEDLYVQGDSEFDGAVQFDGLPTGAAGLTITGAAVNLNVSSNFAANVATGTSTGTVTIGGAAAQIINIGDGAAAKTVTLGSSNSTSTTTLLSGSGALNLNASNNQPTNIGTGTTTGTVTIGGAGTQTINIGDGAAIKTVTLGSNNSSSSTDILSGTGNLTINDGAGAATTSIGTGATTGTITIGGSSAQTLAIGNGAAAMAVTLGSTNSTSATTINAGSGNIVIAGDITGTGPATTVNGLAAPIEAFTGAANNLTIDESGKVFTNAGDGDGSGHVLPEGSTANGVSYTFVVLAAQTLNIDPADGTDQILGLTDGAGDSIQSAAIGDSITLTCVGDDAWVVSASNNSANNADAWVDAVP